MAPFLKWRSRGGSYLTHNHPGRSWGRGHPSLERRGMPSIPIHSQLNANPGGHRPPLQRTFKFCPFPLRNAQVKYVLMHQRPRININNGLRVKSLITSILPSATAETLRRWRRHVIRDESISTEYSVLDGPPSGTLAASNWSDPSLARK